MHMTAHDISLHLTWLNIAVFQCQIEVSSFFPPLKGFLGGIFPDRGHCMLCRL